MRNKKNIIFLFSVGIITIIMAMIPTGFDNPSLTENVLYEKGEILETFDEGLQEISVVTIGIQKLKIKLLSGEFKDSVFVAENVLNGQKNIDKVFSKGDKALIVITLDKVSRQPLTIKAQDFYRLDIELILVAVFVLALLAFAGFTGLKAVLSFVFTALCFWKLLLPMYLNGYNPFLTGILITFVTAAAVILLVSGIGKKGFTALCGCFCGICFTGFLAFISGYFFKIPATVQDYSEALIYGGFRLDFSGIFISTVFISASGALMDVSTDIAAALDEIHQRLPELDSKELIKSGFRIARPVIGSMTTTLLFAYSGGFMFAFMAFMTKGMPFVCIFSSNYISAEFLHTMVGSLGLVLTAPLTAVVGGFVYGSKRVK